MNNTYKCPSCGGPLTFDQESQKLKCPYCDYSQDVSGYKANEEAIKHNHIENQYYVCNYCGGEVFIDEKSTATSCPFCDNPIVLSNKFNQDLKIDYIVPFQIKKDEIKTAFENHMKSKKFLPQVFKEHNLLKEIKGIYVPYWIFDITLENNSTFKGEIIKEQIIGEKKHINTSYYDLYRKASANFKDLPVSASKKLDEKILDSLEPFDLNLKKDFTPDYLSGFYAENYDSSADEKINHILNRTKRSMEDEVVKSIIGYDDLDTLSNDTVLINQEVKYALLPIWILTTRYNGNEYVFASNGINGKLIGDLPFDKSLYLKHLIIRFIIVSIVIYVILTLLA